jgi:predicted dehydrogenase
VRTEATTNCSPTPTSKRSTTRFRTRRRGDTAEPVEVEDDDRYGLQLDNISEAIRGEAEPLLGRLDALGQARAIAALYRSAESATPQVP